MTRLSADVTTRDAVCPHCDQGFQYVGAEVRPGDAPLAGFVNARRPGVIVCGRCEKAVAVAYHPAARAA